MHRNRLKQTAMHRNPSLMIHKVSCVTAPLTRKEHFSVTYVTPVGTWTASSPPSLPSLPGYGNVPCVPLLPPDPAVPCDTSASPLPSFTMTLTKHHLGGKKTKTTKTKIKPPSLAGTTYYFQPPSYGGGADISRGKNNCTFNGDHPRSRPQYHPLSLS